MKIKKKWVTYFKLEVINNKHANTEKAMPNKDNALWKS